jgi:hypothetical protein
MSSRRLKADSKGQSYEKFTAAVLVEIGTVTPVDREADFGTDLYLEPRVPFADQTELVMELCSVQVKGGGARFQYGGLSKKKWNIQDFIWLQSRGLPHYLA